MSTGRSAQDGLMAEQESFAKSLPSESRSILNATMAYVAPLLVVTSFSMPLYTFSLTYHLLYSNMLDMGQANISPSDFADRDQHFQYASAFFPFKCAL